MPTAFLKPDRSLAGERFFLRPWRALWLGAALLLLFVLLALLVPAQPLAIEQHWADWMREIQTALLKQIALIFNYLGRGLGRALVVVGSASSRSLRSAGRRCWRTRSPKG
jgi:hypothetical protein